MLCAAAARFDELPLLHPAAVTSQPAVAAAGRCLETRRPERVYRRQETTKCLRDLWFAAVHGRPKKNHSTGLNSSTVQWVYGAYRIPIGRFLAKYIPTAPNRNHLVRRTSASWLFYGAHSYVRHSREAVKRSCSITEFSVKQEIRSVEHGICPTAEFTSLWLHCAHSNRIPYPLFCWCRDVHLLLKNINWILKSH